MKPRSGEMFIELAGPNDLTAPLGAACLVLSPHKWAQDVWDELFVSINIASLRDSGS